METQTINNPFILDDPRIKALTEAKDMFLAIVDEFSQTKKLSQSEISELKSLIERAYIDRKIAYFIQGKEENLHNYLDSAISLALGNIKEKNTKDFTKMFYIRHKAKFSFK